MLVTPHAAALSARENERITELFVDNLRRYLDGQPLRNRVEPGVTTWRSHATGLAILRGMPRTQSSRSGNGSTSPNLRLAELRHRFPGEARVDGELLAACRQQFDGPVTGLLGGHVANLLLVEVLVEELQDGGGVVEVAAQLPGQSEQGLAGGQKVLGVVAAAG